MIFNLFTLVVLWTTVSTPLANAASKMENFEVGQVRSQNFQKKKISELFENLAEEILLRDVHQNGVLGYARFSFRGSNFLKGHSAKTFVIFVRTDASGFSSLSIQSEDGQQPEIPLILFLENYAVNLGPAYFYSPAHLR